MGDVQGSGGFRADAVALVRSSGRMGLAARTGWRSPWVIRPVIDQVTGSMRAPSRTSLAELAGHRAALHQDKPTTAV